MKTIAGADCASEVDVSASVFIDFIVNLSRDAAVDAAIASHLDASPDSTFLVCAPPDQQTSLVDEIQRALIAIGHRSEVLRPRLSVRSPGSMRRIVLHESPLRRVAIPAVLATAGDLLVAIEISDLADPARTESPIALWTSFLTMRSRLSARLADPKWGLAAEIAAVFHPTLILISARIGRFPLVASTANQIAAELITLSLAHMQSGGSAESIGPWQDDLVQRATELSFGLRHPNQLRMSVSIPTDGEPAEIAFVRATMIEVAARMGIAGDTIDWREFQGSV